MYIDMAKSIRFSRRIELSLTSKHIPIIRLTSASTSDSRTFTGPFRFHGRVGQEGDHRILTPSRCNRRFYSSTQLYGANPGSGPDLENGSSKGYPTSYVTKTTPHQKPWLDYFWYVTGVHNTTAIPSPEAQTTSLTDLRLLVATARYCTVQGLEPLRMYQVGLPDLKTEVSALMHPKV